MNPKPTYQDIVQAFALLMDMHAEANVLDLVVPEFTPAQMAKFVAQESRILEMMMHIPLRDVHTLIRRRVPPELQLDWLARFHALAGAPK